MMVVRDRFSPSITTPLIATQQAITDLVLELLAVLYPHAATRNVGADDLRKRGFDPATPGPDPHDYW